MLFEKTFTELEKHVPNNTVYSLDEKNIEDWKSFSVDMMEFFLDDFNELKTMISSNMKLKPFKNFQTESYYFTKKSNEFCAASLEINENYNLNMGLRLYLHAFECDNIPLKHSLKFQLYFDGEKESRAFKEMYLNYRRIIEILLRKVDRLMFFYATNNQYASGKSIYNKLSNCFLKNYDNTPEQVVLTAFSIYCNEAEILDIFKVFIALLDSCYNYAIDRKDKDKILRYYHDIVE